MTPAGQQAQDLAEDAAAETIASLRREIDGLRASAQLRAIIEQAKGILVEREGISLDQAFLRLRRLSQQHNVRLVEVAATIVGVAAPPGDTDLTIADGSLLQHLPASPSPSTTWRKLQQQPDVRRGMLGALLDAVAGAPRGGDEGAQLLMDLLSPYGISGVTVYRSMVDGSLRGVGSVGIPMDVASAWRSIPPGFDVPLTRAIATRRPVFLGGRDERVSQFPALKGSGAQPTATASFPVLDDQQVRGAVGLLWDQPVTFTSEMAEGIERAVARVAPLVLRNTTASDPDLEWIRALLSLHLDPWILLDSIPSSSNGRSPQFVVQDAAEELAGSTEWLGRRLLELWPDCAADGTLDMLASLSATGVSVQQTVVQSGAAPWAVAGARLRCARLGQRVVLVWRTARPW